MILISIEYVEFYLDNLTNLIHPIDLKFLSLSFMFYCFVIQFL